MRSIAPTADLTPGEVNLRVYQGVNDTLRIYRRDPDTQQKLSLASYSNPVAVWKRTRGGANPVPLSAVIVGDDVVVTISALDKTSFDLAGVWQVDVTDDNDQLITLVTGSVTLEREVGE